MTDVEDRWRNHFEGVVNVTQLEAADHPFKIGNRRGVAYVCPCGGEDHYAIRMMEEFPRDKNSGSAGSTSPAGVLNCFEHGHQWLIVTNVDEQIYDEEVKYLALLKGAEKIVARVIRKRGITDDAFVFLKDTHGIVREVAEDILAMNPVS